LILPVAVVTALVVSSGPTQPSPKVDVDRSANKLYAQSYMMETYQWDQEQFICLETLWSKESGWNHLAQNPSSGAYGIPQSLPGNKMQSAGSDWKTNPETQIKWGLNYILKRYDTPCGAYQHFQKKRWY
jgi:hypothetical protein